jgi:hypothetical protein
MNIADLVQETTTGTSAATIVLGGATSADFRTFLEGFAVGMTDIPVTMRQGKIFESGRYTLTSATTLTQTLRTRSSAVGNAAVTFAAGAKSVVCGMDSSVATLFGAGPASISGGNAVGDVLTAVMAPGYTSTAGQWDVDGTAVAGATTLTTTRLQSAIGKGYGFTPTGIPFRATAPVTVAAAVQAKTVSSDTLTIFPTNYNEGNRILFLDAARTKSVIKNPAFNTVSMQVAPNSLPNGNNNGNWTEVYVLTPGQEVEVTADTRQWKARILDNAAVYNQKIVVESEASL